MNKTFSAALLVAGALADFDLSEAYISRQLSADAYCGWDNVLDHTFEQFASGFVATKQFRDLITDSFGYIGYMPDNQTIYVVFRGSSNIQNWITNIDFTQTYYETWPECNCKVHSGFYASVQNMYGKILPEVQRLMTQLPFAKVRTTGHSLGGVQAQLTMMELKKSGIDATMTNFGQPRAGNLAYAEFSDSLIPDQYRMVHYQDEVPHLPPTAPIPYHHTATEMYITVRDYQGEQDIHQCDGSGEDPNCMDQWGELHRSTDDHLIYLGCDMSCGQICPTSAFLQ